MFFRLFFRGWFGLGFVILWLACQPRQQSSGGACQTEVDCRLGLRCILAVCSDGALDALCTRDTDCRKGFVCFVQRCQRHGEKIRRDGGVLEKLVQEDLPAKEHVREAREQRGEPASPIETKPEITQCRSHTDCGPGSYCLLLSDRITSQCRRQPKRCQSDRECEAIKGTICRLIPLPRGGRGQHCVYPPKTTQPLKGAGRPCSQGKECSSGVCLASTQECGAFCRQDNDCPNDSFYCGTYSLFQAGEYKGCYRRCTTDSDCPEGYKCNTQARCVPDGSSSLGGPCLENSNCPEGGICLGLWSGGYCITSCTATEQRCDGTQTSLCRKGYSCQLDPASQQRRCTPLCPKGSVCNPLTPGYSYCLLRCQKDSDCRKSYFCGVSFSSSQKVCWPRGTRRLGDLCEHNIDCISGMCRQFTTGRYCTQRCGSEGSCRSGYSCRALQQEKFCEKNCAIKSDCPEGYQCDKQQCIIPQETKNRTIGESCTENSHCRSLLCLPSGKRLSGISFPHGYCSTSCEGKKACPANSYCASLGGSKLCLRTCSASNSCHNRKNYFCSFQRVPVSPNNKPVACSAKKPCPKSSIGWTCHTDFKSSTCALGFCLPRGIRQDGQTCTHPLDCQSGQCYIRPTIAPPTACTSTQTCTSTTRPYCDMRSKQCVACLHTRHCQQGQQCVQGRCTTGGYCVTPCTVGTSQCPQQTQCNALRNMAQESVGSFCLPQCQVDTQCLQDFVCRTQTCQFQ